MRNIILVCIVCLLVAGGWMIYFEREKRAFDESLPQVPRTVEQPINKVQQGTTQEIGLPEQDIDGQSEPAPETLEDQLPETVPEENVENTPPMPDNDDWRINDVHSHTPADVHAHKHDMSQQRESTPEKQSGPKDFMTQIKAIHTQLIEEYGATPEVISFIELDLRAHRHERLTLDEQITHMEGIARFFPHPDNQESLETLRELKRLGIVESQ